METLYRPVQILLSIYIILLLLFNLKPDNELFLRTTAVLLGIFICSFFLYFSYFYFFSIHIKEIKKIFYSREKFILFISSLFLGIPFGIMGIVGVFYVLKWPGIIILYFTSVITLFLAALLVRTLKSKVIIESKTYDFINKNLITLFVILVIFTFVISFDLSGLDFELSIPKGPRERIRH